MNKWNWYKFLPHYPLSKSFSEAYVSNEAIYHQAFLFFKKYIRLVIETNMNIYINYMYVLDCRDLDERWWLSDSILLGLLSKPASSSLLYLFSSLSSTSPSGDSLSDLTGDFEPSFLIICRRS